MKDRNQCSRSPAACKGQWTGKLKPRLTFYSTGRCTVAPRLKEGGSTVAKIDQMELTVQDNAIHCGGCESCHMPVVEGRRSHRFAGSRGVPESYGGW